MDYIGAVVIVIVFIFLIKRLRLIENSMRVVTISKKALGDIKNPELSDDDKEVAVQKHALQLVRLFFIVTISAVISLGIPVGLIKGLDYMSLLSFDNVVSITLSVWFLVTSTIVIGLFFWLTNKNNNNVV